MQIIENVTHYINDVTHYINDVTRYINDVTRYINDVTRYINDVTRYINDVTRYINDVTHIIVTDPRFEPGASPLVSSKREGDSHGYQARWSLEIPVYFMMGRHDCETPHVLVEQYYEVLRLPRKS